MHDLMHYCCYYAQLAYPGKLYITDNNSCFKSDVEDTTLILPHSDVTSAEKLPSSLDGESTSPIPLTQPPLNAPCTVPSFSTLNFINGPSPPDVKPTAL